jgi:hypothetical protein
MTRQSPDAPAAANSRVNLVFYACQFFYGGWFLFHGLNFWFGFFVDPSVRPGPGLIPALVSSGVMTLVKGLEIVIGLALLADRWTALAAVAAWPLTIVIAYVNAAHHKLFGVSVALIIITLNAAISLGHLDRYRPMLARHVGPPTAPGLRGRPGERSDTLPLPVHLMAAIAGLAAAVLITYGSIHR